MKNPAKAAAFAKFMKEQLSSTNPENIKSFFGVLKTFDVYTHSFFENIDKGMSIEKAHEAAMKSIVELIEERNLDKKQLCDCLFAFFGQACAL